MPAYVHSYLRPTLADDRSLVLERSTFVTRAFVVGCVGLGGGLAAASLLATAGDARFGLGVAAFAALVTGASLVAFARAERVVFDRVAGTLTFADGSVLGFPDVYRLIVKVSHDSDGGPAYGLALETAQGTRALSWLWCWDEDEVRAAAQAIVRAFPDLPFDPSPRRED